MTGPGHPPLSAEEKRIVAALSICRLFAGIGTAELIELLPFCRVEPLPAGREIFQDGDPGTNLYVIAEGRVDIRMETIAPNLHVTLATIGAGDTFGELSFTDDKPRSGSARCREDCELIVINGYKMKEHWDSRKEAGAAFHGNMARLLAERLRKMNYKILSILRQNHYANSMNKDNPTK